ncbi:MAG: Mur ligase family protein [Candidatus Paceibacterota bacterium]
MIRTTLRILAKNTIKKYQPEIIGVAGGVGKTSAMEAIFLVLKQQKRTRIMKNFEDAELSALLAILGGEKKSFLAIVSLIFLSVFRLIFKSSSYPEVLILEYESGREKNLKKILLFARPNIAVVTAFGEIPPGTEFFPNPQAAMREKGKIVEHLPASGFAILNYDDPEVFKMKERTKGKILTYGFKKGADILVSGLENKEDEEGPKGISFKIGDRETFVPVRINGTAGKTQAYAAAAGAAVGLILSVNLVKISQALSSFSPSKGRMKIVKGIKKTFILDDTYESSPLSLSSALETLKKLSAKRKIAVLGDMTEIGRYSIEAHEEAGRKAAKAANIVITAGARSKFIAEAAIKAGMPKKNIFSFEDLYQAGKKTQEVLKEGDLVLIKGGKELKMEKAVEEIMMEPMKARELILQR